MKTRGTRPATAQTPVNTQSQSSDGQWKKDLAVAGVTVAAAAGGTLLGAEIGAHMMVDHVVNATQGHGLFAIFTAPVELARSIITHYAPWAVGTGTVSGALGYAVGRAATKGAPLEDETPKP